jgi:ferredoxin
MAVSYRMRVDMIACDGRGVCAELFPERISLDDWGYPILDPAPIRGRELLAHAKRAVAACPLLALTLEPVDDRHPSPPPVRR